MIPAALLALILNSPQDTLSIRDLVDLHFSEVGPERRRLYEDRLTSALGKASPQRAKRILEFLPRAAQFHSSAVEFEKNSSLVYAIPSELLIQGYDAHVDQLEARVARAAAHDDRPETRALISAQIKALFAAARETLKSNLLGDVGAAYSDQQLNGLERSWMESMDMPLHEVLDRPVPPDAFERVLGGIRRRADDFVALVLTEDDLQKQGRLDQLRVSALMDRLREALYEAARAIRKDYDPELTRKVRAWTSEVHASRDAFIRKLNDDARKRRVDESSPGIADAGNKEVTRSGFPGVQPPVAPSHSTSSGRSTGPAPRTQSSLRLCGGILSGRRRADPAQHPDLPSFGLGFMGHARVSATPCLVAAILLIGGGSVVALMAYIPREERRFTGRHGHDPGPLSATL